MSTFRLLNLLGSSIFRINHPSPGFLPPLRSAKRFPSPSLRLHRSCSSAAFLRDNATTYSPESPLSPTYHPWKEWVAFVDRLKAKGYVSVGAATGAEEKAGTSGDDGVIYTDTKLLKDACLQFARDRYDIIKCNFMNFARNVKCRECGEDGPTRVGEIDFEMKKGDWICPQCSFMNFARNIRCLKCKTEGPERAPASKIVKKDGDWNCPKCDFMNFASNLQCLQCNENRPKRQLNPGEWTCPSCYFLNFRRNISCKRCNHERSEEVDTQYDDMAWKKPF